MKPLFRAMVALAFLASILATVSAGPSSAAPAQTDDGLRTEVPSSPGGSNDDLTHPRNERLRSARAEVLEMQVQGIISADARSATTRDSVYVQLDREDEDLIFTNLDMPRLSGLELLREIKSSQATRDIPVIVVSSRQAETMRARTRELGAANYLTKPVTEDVVARAVKDIGTA